MKILEAVIDALNEEFAPSPPFHESVMKKAYMVSPQIRKSMTPLRAGRVLARNIRRHSRKVRHVYATTFEPFTCPDGRRIITACLFVLKHKI